MLTLDSLEPLFTKLISESLRPLDDDSPAWKPVNATKHQAEWLWAELEAARNESRRLFRCNEFAIGGTLCRTNYIVGDGFKYEFQSRFAGVPVDAESLRDLNDWLDGFDTENDLASIEAEAMFRLDRDGEVFLRLFAEGDIPQVRFVEPERVKHPSVSDDRTNTLHGVETKPGDRQTILGYWVEPEIGATPEWVPEQEMVHIKIGLDSSLIRGVPVYYPVFENLIRVEDMLTSMSAMAKARAKIALVLKVAGFSQQRAEDVLSRLTQANQPQADGRELPTTIEKLPYGSMLRLNADTTSLDMPSTTIGASDHVAVLQADLRAIAIMLNMTEWMFTGLADQKYSNAFVVEAPTLKSFRRIQRGLVGRFGEGRENHRASLVWRAVLLSRQFSSKLMDMVKVSCTPPTLEVRDKNAEASVNSTYLRDKIKSRKQVQSEIGLDPVQMKKEIEEENAGGQDQQQGMGAGGQDNTLAALFGESKRYTAINGELYTREALECITEGRDRSHLVKTIVTNKRGRKQTVWRLPEGSGTGRKSKGRAELFTEETPIQKTARQDSTPETPDIKDVYTIPPGSLKTDPNRFQYKVSGIGKDGVTDELKGTSTYNPELGGVLLVWRDPEDGQDYVVNGHHRHELAQRAKAQSVNVRYLDAASAKEARARGALANIAEGRGTATDAAKYLRDSGQDVEHLRRAGISLSGKVASDAGNLAQLSDGAFQRLTTGLLSEQTAVAVAKHLKDPKRQDELFAKLKKREDEGKDWSSREIEQAAKKLAKAGLVTVQDTNLFGTFEDEESTWDQEVEIESFIAAKIGQQAADYRALSSTSRAERTADAGNVLATDENTRRKEQLASQAVAFERMTGLRGPVSDTIAEFAAKLKTATKKNDRERIKSEAMAAILPLLNNTGAAFGIGGNNA